MAPQRKNGVLLSEDEILGRRKQQMSTLTSEKLLIYWRYLKGHGKEDVQQNACSKQPDNTS